MSHKSVGALVALSLSLAGLSYAASPASAARALSWHNVQGNCVGLVWHIEPTGRPVKRLLREGKAATEDLVNVLADRDRAVAAHLVLCKIWAREAECGIRSQSTMDMSTVPVEVGRQLQINAIPKTQPNEVVAEHRSGELVWRTYGDDRSEVVESSLRPNVEWWCDYLESHGLRITTACSCQSARLRSGHRRTGDSCAPPAADAGRYTG